MKCLGCLKEVPADAFLGLCSRCFNDVPEEIIMQEITANPAYSDVLKLAHKIDAMEAAAVRQGTVTQLIRSDETHLAELMIVAFEEEGALPATPEATRERLQKAYPCITFAPTEECWLSAVAIFEAHMDDEADEIIDSLDPEREA